MNLKFLATVYVSIRIGTILRTSVNQTYARYNVENAIDFP